MELSRLLNQGGKVKVEVSVDDLLSFAEFILDKFSTENKVSGNQQSEFGGIALAVEITGYSKSSIYTFVNKKMIPYKKVQGKLWFSKSELLNWVNSGNDENRLAKYMK